MLTGTHADDVPVSGFATTVGIGGALPSTTGPAPAPSSSDNETTSSSGGSGDTGSERSGVVNGVVDGVIGSVDGVC